MIYPIVVYGHPVLKKIASEIEEDYPDAFIIAVKDSKILPLKQALEKKNKNRK